MREKVFDKLVDEVTERVTLNILGAHWVCYRCGDKSVIERVEKLEQEAARRMPTVDAVEVVRCKDCRWFGKYGCAIRIVDESDKPKENDYCSFGERRTDE